MQCRAALDLLDCFEELPGLRIIGVQMQTFTKSGSGFLKAILPRQNESKVEMSWCMPGVYSQDVAQFRFGGRKLVLHVEMKGQFVARFPIARPKTNRFPQAFGSIGVLVLPIKNASFEEKRCRIFGAIALSLRVTIQRLIEPVFGSVELPKLQIRVRQVRPDPERLLQHVARFRGILLLSPEPAELQIRCVVVGQQIAHGFHLRCRLRELTDALKELRITVVEPRS